MKRLHSFFLIFSLAALALLAGCFGDGGGGNPTAVFQGTVPDGTGVSLASVAIVVGTSTTYTLAGGTNSLSVTPGANL